MNNTDSSFESWFDILKVNVRERTGVEFRDRASVRDDYDQGRDVYEVVDEIVAEYGEL